MRNPETERSTSRRTFLRAAALSVTGGILLELEGSSPGNVIQAGELQQALREYMDPPRGDEVNRIPEYPLRRQVAVAGNSRISHVPPSNSAFAVVHAGFVAGELSKWRRQFDREDADTMHPGSQEQAVLDIATGRLGNIGTHQGNMARLISALAVTEQTVLSYIEEPDMYNATTPLATLRPPDNALQIATLEASAQPAQSVSYVHDNQVHTEQQETYRLYSSMRNAGIETVFVAGEYTFNPWSKLPACLGSTVLNLLDEGFTVRGISGAVYPQRPQEGIERESEVAYALYDDALPLHEVIHMAKTSPAL